MQIRYIADLHLHDIYAWDWRKQYDNNFDIFNTRLIDNWNARCVDEDITIIAGDVGTCCDATFDVLKELKGNKVLVIGNHDIVWGDNLYRRDLFAGTHEYIERNGVYVQHSPKIPDIYRTRNNYFVHGHHHTYDTLKMQLARREYFNDVCRLNCAADLIGLTPRTLSELIVIKEQLMCA